MNRMGDGDQVTMNDVMDAMAERGASVGSGFEFFFETELQWVRLTITIESIQEKPQGRLQ